MLDKIKFNQVIIFVKSVKYANKLDQLLRNDGFPSVSIHSEMS